MNRYIFVIGGVVSSLGKGVASASIASLLQSYGYKVHIKKLDPYLNIDPGTMSPYQHGEVFVTEDGAETDLDLGYYERFTGIPASKNDTITSGKIYEELVHKERRGEFLGGTVQVIPHLTNIIKNFITSNNTEDDFVICEIGGTVGDIEALPYLEAVRQIRYERGALNTMCILLTLLPYIATAGELKTKPTQHSVKELRSIGIQPDMIICRADREISVQLIEKIAMSCSLPEEMVISGLDQKTIYHVPLAYHHNKLDRQILKHFSIINQVTQDLKKWHWIEERWDSLSAEVNVAIVGKYNQLQDAYKSLLEAFMHAGLYHHCKVHITWIDAEESNQTNIALQLKNIDGVMVPGGFGIRGVQGKIDVIEHARKNDIPLFGICLGMQLMCIEFARNILHITDADSTEFNPGSANKIIDFAKSWQKDGVHHFRDSASVDLGGTMRLGSYPCHLAENSQLRQIYGTGVIAERHRHRFEFNQTYKQAYIEAGIEFSGVSEDGALMEAIEMKNNDWYIGVQFHPEYQSRPFAPHPLFISFIAKLLSRKSTIRTAR